MHSSENSRRPQKRRPDLLINTSTSSQSNSKRDAVPPSPPHARRPPVPSKGKPPVSSRALRAQPPSMPSATSSRDRDFEESFLDMTPVEVANKENTLDFLGDRLRKQNPRDSHDLSLPARQVTRDSLVTNMLMSLDKFSLGQINTPSTPMSPFDEPSYGPTSMGGEDLSRNASGLTRQGRMHSSYNHGHNYSYSSDLEGTDVSSQFSRGRRSNSSSGFQSSLGRINSMRETSSQRGNTTASGRPLHSRGGKTSKSSSTNSFDPGYAQVLGSQRWAHGIGGRSSSFDYGQQQRPSITAPNDGPWNIEFSNTFLSDDYEAAPTPNVPGGPRRPTLPSAPAPPHNRPPIPPPEPEQRPLTTERNRSLRSRSATAGRGAAPQNRYDTPPNLPSVDLDSAPAPNVGYEKSKDREAGGVHSSTSQIKERPGFFRRVFGGSSRNLTGAFESSSPTTVSATSVETIERPNSKPQQQHIASQMKITSAPPSRDSQHSQHHVIQKKSSFFRRRKKSLVDTPPVPSPPVPTISPPAPSPAPHVSKPMNISVERQRTVEKPEPSPVSSLRQVMIPYLKGSNPTTPNGLLSPRHGREMVSPEYDVDDPEADWRRKSRGFSPEYEPSPNATIRTVKSQSALNKRSRDYESPSPSPKSPRLEGPKREPPEVPNVRPKPTRDATFFEDSSDTDEDQPQSGPDEAHLDNLLSPDDATGLPGGFPSPPSSGARDSTSASPIEERRISTHDDSSRRDTSPSLTFQHRLSNHGEDGRPDSLGLPIQNQRLTTRASTSGSNTPNRSATSLPSVKVDSVDASPKMKASPLDEPEVTVGEPTEDDRQKAQRIFDGNEDFIQKHRAAAWIGEEGLVRQRTLRAYMDLYDFAEKSVITSLREVCGRLVLRAETQQVDRILVTFSKHWCECNPNHGFKALDVIHTMCYSIMLLNTDLHLADIEQKMTRSQFVKNTMTTIKQALAESAPDVFERPTILPGKNALLSPTESESRLSSEHDRKNWRSSFIPPRSESRFGDHGDQEVDGCGPLVKAPFNGSMRAWEAQMEVVLKDIYNSIRDERLPLFGAAPEPHPVPHPGGLSVMGMLKRSPSVLSKAPSESPSTSRGRFDGPNRPNGGRWNSKSRSRPRVGTTGFSSSRTSFDDGNSIWSPTVSSATWSRYSLGRTQTSMSADSLGSSYPHGDFKQSIGFANALSQAIIREDGPLGSAQSIMSDEMNGAALLEDESLELTGPPWVKEGIVIHKHHLDDIDKRAKDRTWTEVFAVIQKGSMSLFSFSTKSMRQKARMGRKHAPRGAAGGVVGGGNWQENATSLGTFPLRQTLASALPPPGYSRTRQHVWALSLPNGAVHLFQVGTPEISKEFVQTVNYWSARLSTHPLVGGISNIEYGWSDACINNALVNAINDSQPPRPGSAAAGRTSMHSRTGSRQSSLRSSFDVSTSSTRFKLPGDRIHIAEWKPPAQSLRPSNCTEVEQLETLLTYVRGIEEELQIHNQLRSPMLLAFTPRGSNAGKAMANWERKSSYLLKEIVKFRTYVDCLHVANERRKQVYAERDVAQRAARGDVVGDEDENEQEDETVKVE